MNKIIIHWDFTDGTEISYMEGLLREDGFTTSCIQFFTTENDARVVKKDGSYIDVLELLENTGEYTDKEIRPAHNLVKMLVADAFEWKKEWSMTVKIEEDGNGDGIIQLPDEIVEKYHLKEGDTVHLEVRDDGKVVIRFD